MTTDGRVARRQRNQERVLDTVIDLFEAGQIDPAVDDVSERSGVSTRSIYRYFHHREGLMDAALWHLVARVGQELPLRPARGPLDERIDRFVAHRLEAYRRLAPLVHSTRRAPLPGVPADDTADPDDTVDNDTIADTDTDTDIDTDTDTDTDVRGPGGAGNDHPAARSVFGTDASTYFTAEFERRPSMMRRQAQVAADMAVQFESIEYLLASFDGDVGAVTTLLVDHLRHQIDPAVDLPSNAGNRVR